MMSFLLLMITFSEMLISFLPFDVKSLPLNEKVLILLIIDILFLCIIIWGYFDTIKKDFKLFFKDFFNNIEISFKYWLIGLIVMIISNAIILVITGGQIANNEESVRTLLDAVPFYMLFSVSIYAPITEELIFRKSFRDFIKNKWLYIIISGFVFGALHVVTSITSFTDLLYLIPYCSLGIAFSYTYYKTNNIFSTICMHSIHNTMAAILLLIGSGI